MDNQVLAAQTSSWQQILLEQFSQQTAFEAIAVLLGLAYVIFAARESLWAWPSAFISTAIFTVLFWQHQLPMQAALKIFYMAMAVYGLWLWYQSSKVSSQKLTASNAKIHFWPWQFHLGFLLAGTVLTLIFGWLLQDFSQRPFLDAFITSFSVINTFLVVRKVLENWIYWLVIDTAAIFLYWQTGFFLTAVMSGVFLVLALYGLKNWLKIYREQAKEAA